jgi:hypothetical protein
MRRLVEKREFFENKHVRAVPDEGQTWWFCEDYEVCPSSGNMEGTYLRPKYPRWREGRDKWTQYKPLQDKPDLFLRFAQLYEQGDSQEVALTWARRYGLLGYKPDDYTGYEKPGTVGTSWEEVRRVPKAKEILEDGAIGVFWEEVKRAAGILAMYEAALSGDNALAKEVLLERSPFIGGRTWPQINHRLPATEEDHDLETSLVDD